MTGRTLPTMTCPDCGATNPADAQWCSLCARPLGASVTTKPEPPPAAPSERGDGPAHEPGDTSDDASDEPTAEDPSWTCTTCGAANSVVADACATCGTSIFVAHGGASERAVDRTRAAERALVPGAGHVALGDTATGVMVVAVLALAVGFGSILTIGAGAVGAGVLCLLLGLGTWAAAYVDVGRRLAGSPAWLSPGRLLWVALAVVALAVVATTAVAGG